MAEKREEEDAEEEEELIFPLWEKHMLDLKSWRESSHLALIGIKKVVVVEGGSGKDERERDAMVVTNDLLSEKNGVLVGACHSKRSVDRRHSQRASLRVSELHFSSIKCYYQAGNWGRRTGTCSESGKAKTFSQVLIPQNKNNQLINDGSLFKELKVILEEGK